MFLAQRVRPSKPNKKRGRHEKLMNFTFFCEFGYFSFQAGSLDHDKGQKSAISVRRLPWIFWNFLQWIFLPFPPGFPCNLVRKSPQNVDKIARFPGGAKRVESCHVSGCHGFSGPDPWENKHNSHRILVQICPYGKFMSWPFFWFGLPERLLILAQRGPLCKGKGGKVTRPKEVATLKVAGK